MSRNNEELSQAIAVGLCLGGMFWGFNIPSPLLSFGISMGSPALLAIDSKRRNYNPLAVLGSSIDAATPLLKSAAESLKEHQPDEESPWVVKTGHKLATFLLCPPENAFNWFHNLEFGSGPGLFPYGNWMTCGQQREGKTILAKHLLRKYLEQHPGCRVYICDLEAKTHPPDYWFGAIVSDTREKILATLREVKRFLDESDGSDPGLVLLFDEVATTLVSFDKKEREFAQNVLRDVNWKGAKRKVLSLLTMHSLNATELGWNGITTFAPQANGIMFQKFAAIDSNFNNLQESAQLEDARIELSGYRTLPPNSSEPHPVLVCISNQWSVEVIPTLEEIKMTIAEDASSVNEGEDPYPLIRHYIDGIELPDEPLSLRQLMSLCGCEDANQRKKDRPAYAQWKSFLDNHNSGVEDTRHQLHHFLTPGSNPFVLGGVGGVEGGVSDRLIED